MAQWHARPSQLPSTHIALVVLAAASLLAGLLLGAAPTSAFHGAGDDVLHKQIAFVNGEPVADPDPETGAQNVEVTTGDEVTYRVSVSAGSEAGLSDVLIEDVYKPPQQEFVGATDLEGAELECALDIGTEDNTVGCDITLTEEGEGGVLLTFEVIQEAPEGEGCSQITNVATVTFAEELEPRPSNQARIDVCAAAVEDGQITIVKQLELIPGDPESAFPLPDVGFTLFEADCETVVGAEAFTDDAGVVVFADLAVGTYCVVETTALEGFRPIDPIEVELTEEDLDAELTVLNELAFNLAVLKLDCTGITEAALLILDDPTDEPDIDVEACEPGEATFSLAGDAMDEALVIDVVELEILDLEPGAYTITETDPNQVGPVAFEIGEGDLLLALALNPVEAAPTAPPAAPASPTPAPALPDTAAAPEPVGGSPAALPWVLVALVGAMSAALAWRVCESR